MRNFLNNLGYRLRIFMTGRYGDDELNKFLMVLGFICLIASYFKGLRYLSIPTVMFFVLTLVRSLSKNGYKRNLENQRYLKLTGGIRRKGRTYVNMFKERKTHNYYKCPSCKSYVRIRKPPRGKNIVIKCYKCMNEFNKHT